MPINVPKIKVFGKAQRMASQTPSNQTEQKTKDFSGRRKYKIF